MEDPPAVHDPVQCEKTELLRGRLEIKKLKKSVDEWKDAWFHLREIIGKLWWHHPAIDNDSERAYYQHQLNRIRECQKEQS
jgi:hypothetical protein